MAAAHEIDSSVSVSAGGSSTTNSGEAKENTTFYYSISGSGTLGTAKLQVSYDGGSTWIDASGSNASDGSNTTGTLETTDTAPKTRLHVSESGGSSGLTIDTFRVNQP